jgi:hypothetical protein
MAGVDMNAGRYPATTPRNVCTDQTGPERQCRGNTVSDEPTDSPMNNIDHSSNGPY